MSIHRPLLTALLLLSAAPVHADFLFGRLTPPAALEANGPSTAAEVSGDGRVFVFGSGTTNWVAGSVTGGKIIAVDFGANSVQALSTTGTGPVASHATVQDSLGFDITPV